MPALPTKLTMAVFGRLQVAGEFEERWMKPLWLTVVLLTLPLTLQAQQSLEQAQQQSQALVDDAVAAQQRINELDQATRAALEAYRHAVTQADALTDYSERIVRRNGLFFNQGLDIGVTLPIMIMVLIHLWLVAERRGFSPSSSMS